jgi:hypothetical protein
MIRRIEHITRDLVRSRPDEFFVFGDNMARQGFGGQAAAMRGEPNSIGVATLYAPGDRFRRGDPIALMEVMNDLQCIADLLMQGKTINVPTNLPGSGIANLSTIWPELQALIEAFFAVAETCKDS